MAQARSAWAINRREKTRIRNLQSCFCYYVTSPAAIFFNFQLKREGRESNRATNLSPPPRLKMTNIKQNQQTTEKSKVYIILLPFPTPTPPPKGKNIACCCPVQSSLESSPGFPSGRLDYGTEILLLAAPHVSAGRWKTRTGLVFLEG